MEEKKLNDKALFINIIITGLFLIGICIGINYKIDLETKEERIEKTVESKYYFIPANNSNEEQKEIISESIEEIQNQKSLLKKTYECPNKKEFKTTPYSTLFYIVGGITSYTLFDENCDYILFDKDSLNKKRNPIEMNWDSDFRMKDNSDEEKLKLAFLVVYSTNSGKKIDYDILSDEVKEVVNSKLSHYEDIKNYLYSYPYEEVNKVYKKLFGENISNYSHTWLRCNEVVYDKENKVFVEMAGLACGASAGINYLYINREENDGDYKYIYANIGHTEGDDNAYNDFSKEDIVIRDIDYKTFNIDESNYQLFKEYKFIFKKDENDNYYFVSFE